MGLLKSKIVLKTDRTDYICQRYEFKKLRKKVIVTLDPNCNVYFAGTKALVSGKNESLKYKLAEIGSKTTKSAVAYVFPKTPVPITMPFFAGNYKLKLSNATMTKGEFAVVGRVTMEVADPVAFASKIQKTISADDFIELIEADRIAIFKNEFQSVIASFIEESTTEEELISHAKEIIEKVYSNHGEVRTFFNDFGISVNPDKFSLHINALNKTEENYDKINQATLEREVDDILNAPKEEPLPPVEKPLENDMNTIQCPSCFQNVRKGVKFCPHCGFKIV